MDSFATLLQKLRGAVRGVEDERRDMLATLRQSMETMQEMNDEIERLRKIADAAWAVLEGTTFDLMNEREHQLRADLFDALEAAGLLDESASTGDSGSAQVGGDINRSGQPRSETTKDTQS